MQWLPQLLTARRGLRLPLCDGTQRRLAAALVAGEEAGRQLLDDALARDSCLLVWTIAQARCAGTDELRSIAELADWLAPRALALWSDARPAQTDSECATSAPPDASDEQLAEWTEWNSRAARVAEAAAQIARHRGLPPQHARMLGMLHLASNRLSAADNDAGHDFSDLLPQWLCDELAGIGSDDPARTDSVADCVTAAIAWSQVAADSETLPGDLPLDRPALEARVAAAKNDWSPHAPTGLLPGLVEKLSRLRELETEFARALETQKLDSLKELAYGAGHEINNPLANISARAQALLSEERDPERRRMLASINAQAFRAHEMIADMMLFARPPRTKPEPLELNALLQDVHGEMAERAAEQQTELSLHVPSTPLRVIADKTQLAVAIRSLLVNALEALVTGGQVELKLETLALPEPGAQITVSDNGPGIAPETRPHIFDPFYSGREAGRGLGLGLSKCWRIVQLHEGTLDVASPESGGTVFTVTLPAGDSP